MIKIYKLGECKNMLNKISLIVCFIALTLGLPQTSEAKPPGVPNQRCSQLNQPKPGTMCYAVHTGLGVYAEARGRPEHGHITIQPIRDDYAITEIIYEEVARHGNGQVKHNIVARGATVSSITGYEHKLTEVDRLINEFEGQIKGLSGTVLFEAKNKLQYLKERRDKYREYYRNTVIASEKVPTYHYEWSARPRKCGLGNLDNCGSRINFNLYEVRRYLGDPIREYERNLKPAITQVQATIAKGTQQPPLIQNNYPTAHQQQPMGNQIWAIHSPPNSGALHFVQQGTSANFNVFRAPYQCPDCFMATVQVTKLIPQQNGTSYIEMIQRFNGSSQQCFYRGEKYGTNITGTVECPNVDGSVYREAFRGITPF